MNQFFLYGFELGLLILYFYLAVRVKVLNSCVVDLLWLCEEAANFKNGNECASYDEGEVRAKDMLRDIRLRYGRECPWEKEK